MDPDRQAVLQCNREFYSAFASGDMTRLQALWATDVDVSVLHPGWSLIRGYTAVMDSWRRILASAQRPGIRCLDEEVTLLAGAALITCTEDVDGTFLIATNVFVQERGGWKLVHHHATPAQIGNSIELSDLIH